MSKIIIVTGYLAAGKSIFASELSKTINVPCLIKDNFKTAICKNYSILNREDSSKFSAITFDAMMYMTERIIKTGNPIIIEGNFMPCGVKKVDEAGVIKSLAEKHNCKTLSYLCTGDINVLYKRFNEREKFTERGVNKLFNDITYEEFADSCNNLGKFDIGGEIIKIDSTDFSMINFNEYIEKARLFIIKEAF